jgi:hypothetical protein
MDAAIACNQHSELRIQGRDALITNLKTTPALSPKGGEGDFIGREATATIRSRREVKPSSWVAGLPAV